MTSWSRSPRKQSGCARGCSIRTNARSRSGARTRWASDNACLRAVATAESAYAETMFPLPPTRRERRRRKRPASPGWIQIFVSPACRRGNISVGREQFWSFAAALDQSCRRSVAIPHQSAPLLRADAILLLKGGRLLGCIHVMSTILIEVRRAKPADATGIATTHDEAWRGAYQGVIPGPELDKLINRRGPQWWDNAIRKGSRVAVLAFGDCVAGYANYGRNRARSLYYDGELYELYRRPEFQGLGFGRKLFGAARRDLVQSGLQSLVVWALSDNEPAVGFYRALGGKAVARSSERFGTRVLDKIAFAWNS